MINIFQSVANTPNVKDVLTSLARVGARSVTSHFRSDNGIASSSQDFDDISPIIFMTSSSVISLKLDSRLTLVFLVGVYLSCCCSASQIFQILSMKQFAKSLAKVSSLSLLGMGFSAIIPVMLFINLYIFLMSCSYSVTFSLIDYLSPPTGC